MPTTTFPSPCGDYGSYHKVCFYDLNDNLFVLFPSPCGDYGSYPDLVPLIVVLPKNMFPSPCGDYGSYQNYYG